MEIRLEFISHDKAKKIVEDNLYEPINKEKVKHYTEVMNDGEWVNANEHHLFNKKHYTVPLIFTEDGHLWEGKHRIYALANSNASGYKFVCLYGWDKEKATREYQTGKMKCWRWGLLVYAMYQLASNNYEPTKIEI
jgi:hypothetical protein